MRTLTGELEDILITGKNDPHNTDFVAITLTDQHAILDAMNKLRTAYPNTLQLEKTFLQNHPAPLQANKKLQNNEQAMFNDFFKEVTGQAMNTAQQNYIADLLKVIHREQAEGKQWNPLN